MVWFQPLLPRNSSDLRHDANLSCKPLLGPGWGVGCTVCKKWPGSWVLSETPGVCTCMCDTHAALHSIQYFDSLRRDGYFQTLCEGGHD